MTQPTQPLPPATGANATAPLDQVQHTGAVPASAPPLKLAKKLTLPTGVATNVKQHVLLVRDRSSSMHGQKVTELNMASIALGAELGSPGNKDGFLVSVVDFSNGADICATAEPATALKMPEAKASGGTNFDAALLKAIKVVEDFASRPNPEGWHYLRPHVLFLSDGHSTVSDKNITSLHEIADVTAIAYGADAAQGTLARIASDGQVQVVGTSGHELRRFLAEVGKTLSDKLSTAR